MAVQYFITGAAGHLGNTIVRKLCETGCAVRALVLPGDKAAEKLPEGITVYPGNILQEDTLQPFFSDPQGSRKVVIHCAGKISTASSYQKDVYKINVLGTRNILKQCCSNDIDKFVYVSSVHAIPEMPKGIPITEIKQFDPDRIVGPYGKSKAEASALVMDAAKAGLNASIVLPSGICGPWDYGNGYLTQLILDYAAGRLRAGVQGGFDFVDVRDAADGILACCKKGRGGEGYILSNRYITIPELLKMLNIATGYRRIRFIFPLWAAKAVTPLCAAYYKITRQRPLFSAYSLYTLGSNGLFSCEKAKRELGYHTRPFMETVVDTVEWLKQQKRL